MFQFLADDGHFCVVQTNTLILVDSVALSPIVHSLAQAILNWRLRLVSVLWRYGYKAKNFVNIIMNLLFPAIVRGKHTIRSSIFYLFSER